MRDFIFAQITSIPILRIREKISNRKLLLELSALTNFFSNFPSKPEVFFVFRWFHISGSFRF